MNHDEKYTCRKFFKLKINESNGSSFEDLFTKIMSYYDKSFRQVKPRGSLGDQKNDGYISDKGIYYQVYGPEDLKSSVRNLKNKIKKDLEGLISNWNGVKEYYFVVNDKYNGSYPDVYKLMDDLKDEYKLSKCELLQSNSIENIFFELKDDEIFTIVGPIPDLSNIKNFEFATLSEVLDHIANLSVDDVSQIEYISVPDWDDKIKFNGLSDKVRHFLASGDIYRSKLDEYLDNNGNFLSDDLKRILKEVYETNKKDYAGDTLFFKMLKTLSPNGNTKYMNHVLVVMSKYFESCDIFEDPEG